MSGSVAVTRPAPQIVQLTLDRPDRLNALDHAVIAELHTALTAVATDPACRVVLLTGAGRAFCAGADLAGVGAAPGAEDMGEVQGALHGLEHISGLTRRLRALPQPVIAAVNGAAVGAGLALALGADVRIAGQAARFGVAFVRVGLSGGDMGTSWLLPRLIGAARAADLMLTGRIIDAAEAERAGLVARIAADPVAAALEYAETILANSPFGVAMTKAAITVALEIPTLDTAMELENRTQVLARMTADSGEAISAFREKRAPTFRNR